MSEKIKCLFCGKDFKATKQQIGNGFGKFCSHSCSMKSKIENVSGQKYGSLIILKRIEGEKCLCRCNCGKETIAYLGNLRSGHTKSCGCLRNKTKPNFVHGLCKTRIHQIWWAMKQRTNDKNSQAYKTYGGRGIKLCDEWFDFLPFYNWALKNGYKDNLTIDRIDVNGNYEPSNCRWITMREQSLNTRRNVYFMLNGEKVTLSMLLEKTGYSETSYYRNIKKNNKEIKYIFKGLDFKKFNVEFCGQEYI